MSRQGCFLIILLCIVLYGISYSHYQEEDRKRTEYADSIAREIRKSKEKYRRMKDMPVEPEQNAPARQQREEPAENSRPATRATSRYYDEGYHNGYGDGEADATGGSSYQLSFNPSSDLSGSQAGDEYEEGYTQGYEDGYKSNKAY